MSTKQVSSRLQAASGGVNHSLDVSAAANVQLTAHQHQITDNLEQLIEVLPPALRLHIEREEPLEDLLEIVMDLGRIPEARFAERVVELGADPVSDDDLDYVVGRVGSFGKDNRAGIERTLHRISAIRNRQGRVVGLTCRIGRAVYGTIDIIQDVVESGKSILMLGRPGRGKTTKLREVARILSDQLKKRVVIVDTSNEIAGDGDIPHPAIGRARRMQVAEPVLQHHVMIEAVENHMPEVIVIDEIGTEQEAFAARTIAERGVQLVGTAHGNSLENLMMNPTLSDLVGGIHAVTLSDDEAKRRGTQKTVLERKAPPTFDVVIEIIEVDKLALHLDVERTVDRMLRGGTPRPEIRIRNQQGEIEVVQHSEVPGSIREMPDRNRPDPGPGRTDDRDRGRKLERTENPNAREPRSGRARWDSPDTRPENRPDTSEDAPRSSGSGRLTPRIASPASANGGAQPAAPKTQALRVFPYGVSRSRLDRAIAEIHVPAYIARDLGDADVVVALKATYKREPGKMREATQKRLPIYTVRSNTYAQIANCIRELFGLTPSYESEEDEMEAALLEAQDAIDSVKQNNEPMELAPANSYTRRLQHQLVERYQLVSESVGVEPQRRVRILPVGS
jgi:stage III sporulation protein SpoIIIAA